LTSSISILDGILEETFVLKEIDVMLVQVIYFMSVPK